MIGKRSVKRSLRGSEGGVVGRTRQLIEGPIVRNAATLYGSTIITSSLGFFYWFVAAHMVSPVAVGTASAVISASQFLAMVCVLGLSTLVISELSADRSFARSLILSASVSAGMFAVVISITTGLIFGVLATSLQPGLSGPTKVLLFIVISTLSTVLVVMDDACIGLFRGDLQLRRNTLFAVCKLAAVPALIAIWPEGSGAELVLAWIVGLTVSLITVYFGLRRADRGNSVGHQFFVGYTKKEI